MLHKLAYRYLLILLALAPWALSSCTVSKFTPLSQEEVGFELINCSYEEVVDLMGKEPESVQPFTYGRILVYRSSDYVRSRYPGMAMKCSSDKHILLMMNQADQCYSVHSDITLKEFSMSETIHSVDCFLYGLTEFVCRMLYKTRP